MFQPSGFGGKSLGYTTSVFNPATGRFTLQRYDLELNPLGGPVDSPTPPNEQEIDPDTGAPIQSGQAAPAPGTGPIKFTLPDQGTPEATAPSSAPALPFLGSQQARSPSPPAPVAAPAPAAVLPTLSPQQALSPSFPAGRFIGTNGLTYEKTAEGKIVRVQ
jgi:hypothetical protein